MKVIKTVFLALGLITLVGVAVAMFVSTVRTVQVIYGIAHGLSATVTDPSSAIWIGVAGAAVGGLLLGLGIGLPLRTARSVRHEAIEELHRQEAATEAQGTEQAN